MIEGDLETKNITLCSNHFMDLPVVRELGDNQVMADIENPQAPGLTRSTAQELHKWLFGNASGTSSTDSYTLLTAIMLSVGAIDCSFAQYTEHFCRVEVSTAKLRKIIAAKGMRASISLKDCNYLYNQRRNTFVYKKSWIKYALDAVGDKLGPVDTLLYKPYDIEAAKVCWGKKVMKALGNHAEYYNRQSLKRKRGFTAKTAWEFFGVDGDDDDDDNYSRDD